MRSSKPMQNKRLYEFGVFTLNTNDGLFANGKPVKLTPKIFQILVLFLENRNRVIFKNEIFEKIWEDTFVEDGVLSFNISKLRQTLAKYDNQTVFIETIPKRGFRFNADVKEIIDETAETEIVYEKYQRQELIIEEHSPETSIKPVKTNSVNNRLKIYLPLTAILLVMIIGGFSFWRIWQKNQELRSFDSLQVVKLTSWKSTGSNVNTKFKVSNSGKVVVFSATKEETQQLFVKQLNSSEEFNITKNSWHNFSPVWSPDDQKIAFVSVRGNKIGIYAIPSFGGDSELVKLLDTSKISLLKWSQIESAIFYEAEGNLFKLNFENKEALQLTNLPSSEDGRYFALSFDETKIAYCQKNNGQTDILMLQLSNGQVKQITNNPEVENNLIWHPDGSRILYEVIRGGSQQINVGYLTGIEPLQLTRGGDDYQLLDISNDGTKVFYRSWEDKSDIWKLNIETGEESEFAKENDAEFWSEISTDGKFLSYQKNTTPHPIYNIYESTIEVTSLTGAANPVSIKGYHQKWLSDGKTLSFFRWENDKQINNIWTFNVITGEEKQITQSGVGDAGFAVMPYNRSQIKDYSWSNDGRKLIYLDVDKKNVLLYSADSNETVNLTNNRSSNLTFYCPLWSKDDGKIIFAFNDNKKKIWGIWSVENNTVKEVFTTSETLRLLGWADTNNDIFCLSASGKIKTSPMDVKLLRISKSGESVNIGSFEHISALSFSLSTDGKKLVFTKRDENKDNMFLTWTKNMATNKITDNVYSDTLFGSIIWSPDGNAVYFDKQEKVNTISIIENFK